MSVVGLVHRLVLDVVDDAMQVRNKEHQDLYWFESEHYVQSLTQAEMRYSLGLM